MGKLIDLTGQRFGRLVVLERAENSKRGNTRWKCKCDCGNERVIEGNALRREHTKSCGCRAKEVAKSINTTHSESYTRLYRIWSQMIQRCTNPKQKRYPDYGGRGITICEEWKHSYIAFRNWAMANGYDENAPKGQCTIDRIDNDRGYSPDNCQWTTITEQNRNKRNLHYVTINSETKPVAEWCKQYNLSHQTVHSRLRNGRTPEEAFGIVPRGTVKKTK